MGFWFRTIAKVPRFRGTGSSGFGQWIPAPACAGVTFFRGKDGVRDGKDGVWDGKDGVWDGKDGVGGGKDGVRDMTGWRGTASMRLPWPRVIRLFV